MVSENDISVADGVEFMLPDKFTLTVARSPKTGMWYITSDAHKGYLHVISDRHHTLAEGLSQVPESLAMIIKAQRDADKQKGK
jgi:hypothetical protein